MNGLIVVGFDYYQRNKKEEYLQEIGTMLTALETIAAERNKIPALTEFGGELSDSTWWTGTFLRALDRHKISYALGWRNAGKHSNGQFEFYVPYKGQSSAKDFVKFYKDKKTLFQKEVAKETLYK